MSYTDKNQVPPRWDLVPGAQPATILNRVRAVKEEYDLSFKQAVSIVQLTMMQTFIDHFVFSGDRTDELASDLGRLIERVGTAIEGLADKIEA